MRSANTTEELDNTPWYRQFWAWFLLTPLIAIVIAMTVFISIAVHHADDVVIDNYYREGRMYNERLEQDHQATALRQQALLRFDDVTGEVWLTLAGDDQPPALMLLLQHPTEADLDQQIKLQRVSSGSYRGDLTEGVNYRRYLLLFPGADVTARPNALWRLKGAMDFAQTSQLQLSYQPVTN